MVCRHEGPESARILAHWLDRQPQGFVLFRDSHHRLAGFILFVALHEACPEDLAADPGVRSALTYLAGRAPLRPGEAATMARFWMDRERYQNISPVQSLVGVQLVRHIMTTPGLAFSFLVCADPDFWEVLAAYADFERLAEADFQGGERRYGGYGHDWRALKVLHTRGGLRPTPLIRSRRVRARVDDPTTLPRRVDVLKKAPP